MNTHREFKNWASSSNNHQKALIFEGNIRTTIPLILLEDGIFNSRDETNLILLISYIPYSLNALAKGRLEIEQHIYISY